MRQLGSTPAVGTFLLHAAGVFFGQTPAGTATTAAQEEIEHEQAGEWRDSR